MRSWSSPQKQSSHAEISRWSFQNEYHFGDFRGNVNGLLRHGYDVHLHYSNYGIRTVAFRLPFGLPFPKRVWSQYCGIGELKYKQDRKGDACILSFSPYYDGGELEDIWDPDEYMDDMIEFRGRLIAGDLRHVVMCFGCVPRWTTSWTRHALNHQCPADWPSALNSLVRSWTSMASIHSC